jgi:hypothetical protein
LIKGFGAGGWGLLVELVAREGRRNRGRRRIKRLKTIV